MARKKGTTDAVEILHKLYVKDDPGRRAALEAERVNADVAQMIYDRRTDADLTQEQLAELIGTTQSVVSRLEDADYEGHSLSMLRRIAKALDKKLTVLMTAKDPEAGTLKFAFRMVVRNLRKKRGLSVDALAKKMGVDGEEILAMERSAGCRPTPLTLHRLAKFYGIPERPLADLAGAFKEIPSDIRESATRYAAQADSIGKLTREERKLLDSFVSALRKGG